MLDGYKWYEGINKEGKNDRESQKDGNVVCNRVNERRFF